MTDLWLKSSGPVANQFKVLAGDVVVGHIRLSESAPPTTPWRWTLSHVQHKGRRTPTHGYGATREEALQAFAKSWQMRKGPGDKPRPPTLGIETPEEADIPRPDATG